MLHFLCENIALIGLQWHMRLLRSKEFHHYSIAGSEYKILIEHLPPFFHFWMVFLYRTREKFLLGAEYCILNCSSWCKTWSLYCNHRSTGGKRIQFLLGWESVGRRNLADELQKYKILKGKVQTWCRGFSFFFFNSN